MDIPADILSRLQGDAECQQWQKCYERVFAQTQDAEMALQAAWGRVLRMREGLTVKARQISVKQDNGVYTVRGWGMLFSSEAEPDFHDEHFAKDTDLLLEYYANAPLWYLHSQDATQKAKPIGKRSLVKVYAHGVWVEHELEPHKFIDTPDYKFADLVADIEAGKYAYSSDSINHVVGVGFVPETGKLGVWPVAGWSLVPNPAEPGLGLVSLKYTAFHEALTSRAAANVQPDAIDEPTPREREALKQGDADDLVDESVVTTIQSQTKTEDFSTMPPELMAALAQLLGVENTVEAVQGALSQILVGLGGGDAAMDAEKISVDPAEVRALLGLAAEATDEEVVSALNELIGALSPAAESEELVPARSVDFAVLAGVGAQIAAQREALKSTPRPNPMRFATKGAFGGFNVNKHAEEPNLGTLVQAMVAKDQKGIKAATKAQSSLDNVSGGYMLERRLSDKIIEPLYSTEVVMAAGAQIEPMDGIDSLTIRKSLGGATAHWAGESQTVTQGEVKFGVVNLHLRELVSEVRIPRSLLRNTKSLEQRVRNDIIKAMRLKMDLSFLIGTGSKPTGDSGREPLGILNIPTVTNTLLATDGRTPKIKDLADAKLRMENDDVEISESWGWIFAPRTRDTFSNMTDTTGRPLLRDNWAGAEYKALLDVAYHTTTRIPRNVTAGANSDTSYIFLGDWQECVVGMGQDIEFIVDESIYVREREILIQATAFVDFAVFFPEAFEVISGVRA